MGNTPRSLDTSVGSSCTTAALEFGALGVTAGGTPRSVRFSPDDLGRALVAAPARARSRAHPVLSGPTTFRRGDSEGDSAHHCFRSPLRGV